MNGPGKLLVSVLCSVLLLLFSTSVAFAKVTGPCADCHTMHNSQGGEKQAKIFENGVFVPGGPFGALTKGDCVGCHSSSTGSTRGGAAQQIPIVYNTLDPNYGSYGTDGETLAGGNFYWVKHGASADDLGHNVEGICSVDATLRTPPGFDEGRPDPQGNKPGGGAWPSGQQVTCAGLYGCHGRHMTDDDYDGLRGAHHGDDSVLDGSTVAKSYRFLLGVKGMEDSKWEYRPTSSTHNQYKGVDRTSDSAFDISTISYLCGQCHGEFHNGAGMTGSASPWLRHPTDFDLGRATGDEYQYYNNGSGGTATYSVIAPVASTEITENPLSTVTVSGGGNDSAIVTCISCHRAHGTRWDDLLRWQYTGEAGMKAGSGAGNVGCFICHTTKD